VVKSLEKIFRLIYSNTHLNSRKTVPLQFPYFQFLCFVKICRKPTFKLFIVLVLCINNKKTIVNEEVLHLQKRQKQSNHYKFAVFVTLLVYKHIKSCKYIINNLFKYVIHNSGTINSVKLVYLHVTHIF